MYCRYCGNEISDNAKFCTECGKKVHESVSTPTAEQKAAPVPVAKNTCPLCGGYFSRKEAKCRRCGATLDQVGNMLPDDSGDTTVKFLKVVAAIIVGLLLIVAFSAFGETADAPDPTQTKAPTEAPTEASTEAPTPESIQDDTTDELSMSIVVAAVENELNKHYENISVSADGTTLVVDIIEDGAAAAVSSVINGNNELLDDWNAVVESYEYLNSAMLNLAKALAGEDVSVLLQIKNDQNPENALLMIFNGEVIYNAVETK